MHFVRGRPRQAMFCCLFLCASATPTGEMNNDVRWSSPRPRRPKGRGASFESRGECRVSVEGTTAAALRSACAVTQAGFASGSFPQSRSTGSITNTLVGAIGQQSRPIARLGRHVMPRCAGPAKAGACSVSRSLECRDSFPGSLRRSLHGSGRSAASRDGPLTPRKSAATVESVAERISP